MKTVLRPEYNLTAVWCAGWLFESNPYMQNVKIFVRRVFRQLLQVYDISFQLVARPEEFLKHYNSWIPSAHRMRYRKLVRMSRIV